jgi:hypothetical protein
MKQETASCGVDRRALLSTLAVLPALSGSFLPTAAWAENGAGERWLFVRGPR